MILVLEGLRGIAALFVAIYHSWPSEIRNLPLMLNGWLWVDLFFVLSGSVMSYSYSRRLNSKVEWLNFVVKRFGRLYPLHLITTLAFIGITLVVPLCAVVVKDFLNLPSGASNESPDRFEQMVRQLPLHLLMLHGLGTVKMLDLNVPSWSISTELAVYIAWASIWCYLKSRKTLYSLALIASILSVTFLYFGVSKINFSYMNDYGILRCFAGFSVGTVLPSLWLYFSFPKRKSSAWSVQVVGIVSTAILFYFARLFPAMTYFAPLIFALLIVGLVAYPSWFVKLLSARIFVELGKLSYSIYLWHVPLLLVFKPIASISPSWALELVTVIYLCTLLIVAKFSYLYIESPCRLKIAKFADNVLPKISQTTDRPN